MKTIEQLKAEHAQQLAELEQEHSVAASMPVPPERVTIQVESAPWVTYTVSTVSQAIDIFKTFADGGHVVNMENAKGAFRHICPSGERSSGKGAVIVESNVAIALSVSHGEGYSSANFYFYVKNNSERLVRVVLDFEFRASPVYRMLPRISSQSHDQRGRLTDQRWAENPTLCRYAYKAISLGTGDLGPVKKSACHVYLFAADDGADCSAFTELLDALQSMAAEFDPEEGEH